MAPISIVADSVRVIQSLSGLDKGLAKFAPLAEDSQCSFEVETAEQSTTNRPLFLRYVSSLAGNSFSIKYEQPLDSETSSPSLQDMHFNGEDASAAAAVLMSFARGLFRVGARIMLNNNNNKNVSNNNSNENSSSVRLVKEPTTEPLPPISPPCHHIVGLQKWRVLSVSEVLQLIDEWNDGGRRDQLRISLQVGC